MRTLLKHLVIAILSGSILYSCSNKISVYDYYDSNPFFDYAYIEKNLKVKDIKIFEKIRRKNESVESNLNYEILKSILSSESNLDVKSPLSQDIIGRLTKGYLYLDSIPKINRQTNYIKKKSKNEIDVIKLNKLTLPDKFSSFIPNSEEPFKLEWIEPSDSYNYVSKTLHHNKAKKKYLVKKHYCRTEKVFSINSIIFPNRFYFPRDYLSSQIFCPISIDYLNENDVITREKFLKQKFYLTLNLPDVLEIPILLNSRSLEIIYKENYGKSEEQKAESIKTFYDHNFNNYKIVLSKTKLLLEPSFESYIRNIKYVWDLYLFKLNYQVLNDTFKVSDGVIDAPGQSVLPQIQLKDTLEDQYNNSQYFNTRSYLEQDFKQKQEIYKSYFELVLWKMYECSDFTLNKKEPKKASFIFMSNNPKYPGNYEVFFSIYEPNVFKVKKRR